MRKPLVPPKSQLGQRKKKTRNERQGAPRMLVCIFFHSSQKGKINKKWTPPGLSTDLLHASRESCHPSQKKKKIRNGR